MDPSNGIDSRTQAALWRAGLCGVAADLTPEEINALRENYSTDNAAPTVSMDLEEATSPYDVPATATVDPIFGFHDPIVVSQMVPERQPPLANPIDRVEQMLKARKSKVKSFSHPLTKVHAMDLFYLKHNFLQIYDYVKNSMPALRPLAGLVPEGNKRIPMYQVKFMTKDQVLNLCFLLEDFSKMINKLVIVQELAETSSKDYIGMYRLHLGKRMDSSILSGFRSSQLFRTPKRSLKFIKISSYRRSLGCIKFPGTKRVLLGRTVKGNRPKKIIMIKGAPVFSRVVPNTSGNKSPGI